MAGSEVVLSALVLATCNFLFIKKAPQEPDAKLENGAAATEMEQVAPKANGGADEPRPDSVMVDSVEVERFLKDEEQNGDAVSNPETSL